MKNSNVAFAETSDSPQEPQLCLATSPLPKPVVLLTSLDVVCILETLFQLPPDVVHKLAQVETQSLASSFLAEVQGQKLDYHERPLLEPGQTPRPLSSLTVPSGTKVNPPWTYSRMILKVCKVLIYSSLTWIVLIGQPMKLVEAAHILFIDLPLSLIGR